MKKAEQLAPLLDDIESIVGVLERVSKVAIFIKPRLCMLKAHLEFLRGRKISALRRVAEGSKCAERQGNFMMLAWIRQNEMVKKSSSNFEQSLGNFPSILKLS